MKPDELIDQLLLGKNLKMSEARNLFEDLFSGNRSELILILLALKGESADELAGLVKAVRTHEKPIKSGLKNLTDGCGTGGDGTNTFNISTVASIVAAGAGAHMAKHGNRSISSKCGSADLLEAFDVKIEAPLKRMLKALNDENCRIGYFHAPLYHKSFKTVQPVRMSLGKRFGIRTIFNVAGPLLNPLGSKRQMIGVFRKDLMNTIAEAAQKLNLKHVIVVHSSDGMDELTTTGKTNVSELKNRTVRNYSISPGQFGFGKGKKKNLAGGKASVNKKITFNILSGKDKSEKLDVVLLNAAAILYVSGKAKNFKEGIKLAKKSINSGAALRSLKKLVRLSRGS